MIVYIFPAIIETDDDGYSLYFPDLNGCVTAGDTIEEIIFNAEEALSLHLQGMIDDSENIPEPSDIFEIKLDPTTNDMLVSIKVEMD